MFSAYECKKSISLAKILKILLFSADANLLSKDVMNLPSAMTASIYLSELNSTMMKNKRGSSKQFCKLKYNVPILFKI